jgi:[ribosomal protein S18]-alanine N-acetyltransferase
LSLVVRRATRADLADLLRIEALFPSDRLSRAAFVRLISGGADVWIAESAAVVVGDAVVTFRRGRPARLYSLVTDATQRGRGVGSALLAAAEEGAAARGARSLLLEVRRDNEAAIDFYYRRGYLLLGEIDGYYADGMGALRLRKALASPREMRERPLPLG